MMPPARNKLVDVVLSAYDSDSCGSDLIARKPRNHDTIIDDNNEKHHIQQEVTEIPQG